MSQRCRLIAKTRGVSAGLALLKQLPSAEPVLPIDSSAGKGGIVHDGTAQGSLPYERYRSW